MILWVIGDWNIVQYKLVGNEVEDYQLWKTHGGNLVSKSSGAVLGVHETELVSFVESVETFTPVSVDEAATSSYKFLVPGMFNNLLKFILDHLFVFWEKGPCLYGSFHAAPGSSSLWKDLVNR